MIREYGLITDKTGNFDQAGHWVVKVRWDQFTTHLVFGRFNLPAAGDTHGWRTRSWTDGINLFKLISLITWSRSRRQVRSLGERISDGHFLGWCLDFLNEREFEVFVSTLLLLLRGLIVAWLKKWSVGEVDLIRTSYDYWLSAAMRPKFRVIMYLPR